MLYDQTTSRGYERVHQPVLRSSLATPNLDHEELKLGQLAAVFSELSHVVSRTGPQRAWLSQILPVSKAVDDEGHPRVRIPPPPLN
jgi:hypothetical protein